MKELFYDKHRVKNFNDAIFAIAMTLLILEITIPSPQAIQEYGTLSVLGSLTASFIGLLVSFMVTAIYWVSHLRIMDYVTDINNKLLWTNVFLLLFIVLLPFSTAFYVNGISLVGPFVFYCINLALIGLFNFLMVFQITRAANRRNELTPNQVKWNKARALNPLIIWVLAGALAFVLPNVARFVFFLIFIIQPLIDRYYRKRERVEMK